MSTELDGETTGMKNKPGPQELNDEDLTDLSALLMSKKGSLAKNREQTDSDSVHPINHLTSKFDIEDDENDLTNLSSMLMSKTGALKSRRQSATTTAETEESGMVAFFQGV